ncbi:MAG: biotin-dependent carboxyltransferase family protein [Bacteroidales bacterium]
MSSIKIISSGFFTTIQDGGRYGYRSFGMPVSGAMDFFSHMAGNLLVGNDPREASLECTIKGPEIRFSRRTMIAITGAEMDPMINGKPVEMWTSIIAGRRDKLSFGSITSGTRSYVSFAGGIDVPEIMGSRSTYIRGRLGGYMGRKLEENDRIKIFPAIILFRRKRRLPLSLIPEWRKETTLKIIKGVDYDMFSSETSELLLNSAFEVTNYSDRMGIRLSGPFLKHKHKADVISYPLVPGTIQVPGDGNPVIMLADSQTIGGYTQIANIITADIWKTGQLKPGDKVRFGLIEPDEAVRTLSALLNELFSTFGINRLPAI